MKILLTAILAVTLVGGGVSLITPAMAEMHGKGHSGQHYTDGWKASLTEEQIKQLNKIRLEHKKKCYPIKASLKQAKVELALLMTTGSPKQKDLNKKIDEILKLKGEKLRLKVDKKIKIRKMLTEDQRVQFDMRVLKKAYHGKKGKGFHH
jgi:Spy/CpxP family protein refolding chaperone